MSPQLEVICETSVHLYQKIMQKTKDGVQLLGPDTRSLHSVDEKAPEATALQEVQGVDGGSPW